VRYIIELFKLLYIQYYIYFYLIGMFFFIIILLSINITKFLISDV